MSLSCAAAPGFMYLGVMIHVPGAVPALTACLHCSLVRSRSSWSHSRTSTRHGSGSPDGSRRRLSSCSYSPYRGADDNCQEEQSLLEFVNP